MITIRMDPAQLTDHHRFLAARKLRLPQWAYEEFQLGVLVAALLAARQDTVCWIHFDVSEGRECEHGRTPGTCTAHVHYLAGWPGGAIENWARAWMTRAAFRHAPAIQGLKAGEQECFKTVVEWLPHKDTPFVEG